MLVRSYPPLPLDLKEAARYAHCPQEVLENEFSDCIAACRKTLICAVCAERFPVTPLENGLDLGFAKTRSQALAKNLRGCSHMVVFAATVGLGLDRLIRKYALLSPSKAAVCHALGSAAVETLCDRFCEDLITEYGGARPRFSPGYGDLPLTLQREIFAALSPEKHIGVTLGENLMMTPSKSVTAIVGLPNAGGSAWS